MRTDKAGDRTTMLRAGINGGHEAIGSVELEAWILQLGFTPRKKWFRKFCRLHFGEVLNDELVARRALEIGLEWSRAADVPAEVLAAVNAHQEEKAAAAARAAAAEEEKRRIKEEERLAAEERRRFLVRREFAEALALTPMRRLDAILKADFLSRLGAEAVAAAGVDLEALEDRRATLARREEERKAKAEARRVKQAEEARLATEAAIAKLLEEEIHPVLRFSRPGSGDLRLTVSIPDGAGGGHEVIQREIEIAVAGIFYR